MKKRRALRINLQWVILVSPLFFLLYACQIEQEEKSFSEESALGTDSLIDLTPVEPALGLPAYSDNQILLSSQFDPSETYLAMVFEEEIEDDFVQNKINIRFYRREGTTGWVSIDSVILFEEGRKCFSISSVAFLPLGEQSGFWVETEAGRMGTANAGLTERDNIIYLPGAESASVYRYVKWLREEGELEVIRQGSGDFSAYLSRRLAEGEVSTAEADTFQRAWLAHNDDLYEQMDITNSWFDIRFPDFSPALMDSFPSDNRHRNGDLTVVGGFADPVLAYSEKAAQTFALWVPAGWPNGGGWGFRSLYVEEVSQDGHITVSNRDDVHILLDFPGQRVMFLDSLGLD